MNGFRPSEIPILGDVNLPWYDPDWPWNLGRVARFDPPYSPIRSIGPERPILEIDFSKSSAVAMWAGRRDLMWEHCEPQQVLVKFENRWLVLSRHISEMEVVDFFKGDVDESNYASRSGLPYATYFDLGTEGYQSEFVYASSNGERCKLTVFNPRAEPFKTEWVSDKVKSMIAECDRCDIDCFTGDMAIVKVVQFLAAWGFVQSKHWPAITCRFPALDEFREYLIYLNELYPDGSHPLHGADDADAGGSACGDGLHACDRMLVWGGVSFPLTPNQSLVFRLLIDAYQGGGDVFNNDIEDALGGGELRDSFRRNHNGAKVYDSSWELIIGGKRKDSKRMIDPSVVRANPKKFSDPQRNPQRSPE